jgi:hypothetical protein
VVNEGHLGILKQGREGWHRWRQENPDIDDLLRTLPEKVVAPAEQKARELLTQG